MEKFSVNSNKKGIKRVFHFLYFSILAAGLFTPQGKMSAQPAAELQQYKNQYPDDAIIYVKKDRSVDITFEKNKLIIYSNDYEERMLLQDNANIYAENSVEYSGFTPLLKISAKTLVPEEKKYRTIDVEDFKTNDVMDGAIFHDDTKEKKFYFPSLAEGTKTVLAYERQINEPRFLGAFFFGSYAPIENAAYSITCPKEVQIGILYYNMEESDLAFSKEENKGTVTYTWKWKQIPKLNIESGAPDIRYYIPHVVAYIKDYSMNGTQENISTSVDDLHDWYYTFIKKLDSSKDAELKKIVDSLVTDVLSNEEKVKRIYYWVQSNIKYVAFEEGMDGFIPRQASVVCQKRYGDCKDMSNIITEMLNIAGIEAHLTWIGSRDIPYRYSQVPTPIVDNHMIVTYKVGDKYEFLDATEDHLAFGYPSSFIQGKEALINIEEGAYEIAVVPEVAPEKNTMTEHVSLHLNGNKITGTATDSYSGYYKSRMYRRISGVKADEYTKYLVGTYSLGNNTFLLDTFYTQNLNDRDQNLIANYTFNLRDYSSTSGDEIYINLNLDKIFQNDKIEDDRKMPIEKEFKSQVEKIISVEIPAGYQVDYLPPDASYQHPLFGFTMKYEKTDTEATMQLMITSNHLLLQKDHFQDWNKMITELNKAYSEVVILKKM
ncbi:MAG: DUF3857 domain-containing protein [Chitinophagales bacterium]|nr:DUF3857 domain-containing protein [Chitinophagales bacterium]